MAPTDEDVRDAEADEVYDGTYDDALEDEDGVQSEPTGAVSSGDLNHGTEYGGEAVRAMAPHLFANNSRVVDRPGRRIPRPDPSKRGDTTGADEAMGQLTSNRTAPPWNEDRARAIVDTPGTYVDTTNAGADQEEEVRRAMSLVVPEGSDKPTHVGDDKVLRKVGLTENEDGITQQGRTEPTPDSERREREAAAGQARADKKAEQTEGYIEPTAPQTQEGAETDEELRAQAGDVEDWAKTQVSEQGDDSPEAKADLLGDQGDGVKNGDDNAPNDGLDDKNADELREIARVEEVEGRSSMTTKDALIEGIREKRSARQ